MRVETLGAGQPEVAVVGGVHGDEPCGVAAVERLLEERPPVERPVKLVVANEAAVERGTRFVDADLNRSFPGDPESDLHEVRLAADLAAELAGCTVLSLHSTQSYDQPFAIVDGVDDLVRDLVPHLPVEALVDSGAFVNGRLFVADVPVVEVECGRQGSDAAVENAHALVEAFLQATGVFPGDPPERDLPVFRLVHRVAKPPATRYEVFVDNFTEVEPGEAFAAADGEPVALERAFYPVLLSPEGYADVFGYAAERVADLRGPAD